MFFWPAQPYFGTGRNDFFMIKKEFGLDKCAKCTFVQGKPTKMDNIKIDLDTTIQNEKMKHHTNT